MTIDGERLVQGAKEVLEKNYTGQSIKPAPDLYPHQWNWDSCFIAIGLAHYNMQRAMQEIRALLVGQWKNGMVPQIIFNPSASGYFPGPDVWQSWRSPEAPEGIETSGITQPPVIASAALAIYQYAQDKAAARQFLSDVYPAILRAHQFFYRERNPDGDGLIVVLHPWESGLDNSPPYLDAGKKVHLTYQPKYHRLDLLHVSAQNRPTNKDYDLYVYLLEQMRAVNYNQEEYLKHAPLQVQDVLFNSILCRANLDLAAIARLIGQDPNLAEAWAKETASAINARLWDSQDGTYYSFDRVHGELLKDDTIAAFGTLWGEVAPTDRAGCLVARLQSPERFWPASGYAVPTTDMNSPWFNPENYWLGPVWVNTNWMTLRGLQWYNEPDLANTIAGQTLHLVQSSGYREYFNPFTGAGYGTNQFSWTAALTIDLVETKTGIQ